MFENSYLRNMFENSYPSSYLRNQFTRANNLLRKKDYHTALKIYRTLLEAEKQIINDHYKYLINRCHARIPREDENEYYSWDARYTHLKDKIEFCEKKIIEEKLIEEKTPIKKYNGKIVLFPIIIYILLIIIPIVMIPKLLNM